MSRFEGAAIFDDWLVLDPPLINAQTRRWNGQLANPTMGRCLHEHWRDNFLYVDHSFDEYTSLPSPLVDAGLAGGTRRGRRARRRGGRGTRPCARGSSPGLGGDVLREASGL